MAKAIGYHLLIQGSNSSSSILPSEKHFGSCSSIKVLNFKNKSSNGI